MKKILIFRIFNKDKCINLKMELTPKERIKGLSLPKEITPDLAYFCGVLAGDGSIRFQEAKKQYEIKCVGNPKDEKEFYDKIIKDLIKKLFNLDIKTKSFDKGRTYGFDICSKSLVRYLTEFIGLPLGKKYDKLTIPGIFLNDKELVRKFICGVADTDFHLRIKRGYYPIIAGVSKSESFIKEIKDFLEDEGFKICMYKREEFDKRVNKIVITHRIELSGYKQFLNWMEQIGFRHPKNKEKINLLLKLARDKKIARDGFEPPFES